jgi:hypothetical protein
MLFADGFDSILNWVMTHLEVVSGGAVAVIVLTIVCVVTRQRRLTEMERLTVAATAAATASASSSTNGARPNEEKALQWEPPEHSYADRRGAVRREGAAVRVVLAAPIFRNGVGEGFVLDRSTGGLRITVATAVAPGTNIHVRAANAPDTIEFVGVVVRSCRKNGEFFVLGCEFEKTPPWNVLLLFG